MVVTELLPRGAHSADPLHDEAADAKIAEAIARIAAQGYPGHFDVTRTHVRCTSCRSNVSTHDVRWRAIEIVTGLHQLSVVGGICCPVCSTRGTATTSLDLLNS
jgi:hypothetical protein